MENPLEYYDEAYFERGWERGTAYSGYKDSAGKSKTFKDVALGLIEIFQPSRALEIGCATGPIVKHMNDMGVECHGIDVSDWAVANRLHPNVTHSPAHKLKFETGSFDLVYSCHAIEHIPIDLKDASFAEIGRVSRGGYQFHMLPILGDPPYAGNDAFHKEALQADPTHALLFNRAWWTTEWARIGWHELPANIVFGDDAGRFELSLCQMMLYETPIDNAVLKRCFDWNRTVTATLFYKDQRPSVRNLPDMAQAPGVLEFGPVAGWQDIQFRPTSSDGRNGEIFGIVDVDGADPALLRVAIITETADGERVMDGWSEFKPGRNVFTMDINSMQPLDDYADASRITEVRFGGSARATHITCRMGIRVGSEVIAITPY